MRLIDAEPLEKILHLRCAQYSNDYGSLAGAISGCLKLVQAQPTLTPPLNQPLTLEELREMDGKPVWVVQPHKVLPPFWGIVDIEDELVANFKYCANFEDYDTEWLAYRRKPEEGTV